MLIGNADTLLATMPPTELMLGISLLIGESLRRLLKRLSVNGRLVLTLSDTEQYTSDSKRNTPECPSDPSQRKPTKQRGESDDS